MTRRSLLLASPVLPAALATQRLDFASEADRLTDLTQKTLLLRWGYRHEVSCQPQSSPRWAD